MMAIFGKFAFWKSKAPPTCFSVDEIVGIVRAIAQIASNGPAPLAAVSACVVHDDERLMSLLRALENAELVEFAGDEVVLTPAGFRFADSSALQRKAILADHLMKNVAWVRFVGERIVGHGERGAPFAEIAWELRGKYPRINIDREVRQLVGLARYAGLWRYDERKGLVSVNMTETRATRPPS